jgi:hypothetical protein
MCTTTDDQEYNFPANFDASHKKWVENPVIHCMRGVWGNFVKYGYHDFHIAVGHKQFNVSMHLWLLCDLETADRLTVALTFQSTTIYLGNQDGTNGQASCG